ncbi:MAG: CAP domain-containing protein [Phormidesmis sp.]
MRLKTWWSVALVGFLTVSCGKGSSTQREPVVRDSGPQAKEAVAIASDCAQLNDFFSELLLLTNQARQSAGVGTLQFSYQLGQSAQKYAEEMATQNFFSHVGKDGSTLTSRIEATGYKFTAAGENLAAGQKAARSVFQGWMSSEEHRANILQAEFTEVGFGLFDATGSSDYGRYWVQNFGKPAGDRSRAATYIPDTCGFSIANTEAAGRTTVAGISVMKSGLWHTR